MTWRRRLMNSLLFLCLSGIALLGFAYYWIDYSSRPFLYDDSRHIPHNRLAVVLGTAKYVGQNRINLFYNTRIQAAAQLWQAGKADYFIVSGANPNKYYNEPAEMRRDLIAAGIPADRIQPDYAGLRTLDSILRAEKIFGNTRYTIISQPFHNARAVFLARHSGHQVIAFNARDPVSFKNSSKTRIREIGARFKALLDLFILNKEARIYGEPIPFPSQKSHESDNTLPKSH